ncbi:MAG: hypothetical protein JXR56_07380, partial [Candidatus Cloacimonetes bacterium]|nr:hypothetical protein [Candidatus Cloacimonadota bacterium]
SAMGVPVQIIAPFNYIYDSQAPFVVKTEIVSDKKIDIYFNEELSQSDVEQLSNFIFTAPVNDSENSLLSVAYIEKNQEKVAEITLAKKLVYTMEPYFVKVSNVRDLAGNYILNTRNLASFVLETDEMKVYPNPVYLEMIEDDPVVNFVALPEDKKGTLYIYDFGGDLVFKTSLDRQARYLWNLTNNNGLRVSSGMYFYVVRMDSYLRKGKIAIIN